jgi:Cu+-exporting ATPase
MNNENRQEHGNCCHHESHGHKHKTQQAAPISVSGDSIFTCPMHPEIRQKGPGHCPICGMSLEPLVNTGEVDTTELKDMTKRFWFATAFSLPLFIGEMGSHFFGSSGISSLVQLALATPVCLWSAWPFYVRAVASIKNRNLNRSRSKRILSLQFNSNAFSWNFSRILSRSSWQCSCLFRSVCGYCGPDSSGTGT